MKKHQNFIARLLHRNNTCIWVSPAMAPLEETDIATRLEEEIRAEAPSGNETESAAASMPTICKNGKLFRARLRNGRWETMGPPIGDC